MISPKRQRAVQNNPGIIFQARDVPLSSLPMTDSHLHTSWTDGSASVFEVYHAACKAELRAVLYSEHSRKTSVDWFSRFAAEVRQLPNEPCRAYVGTEVKVESRNGDIDTCDAISSECDFIMASVHRLIANNGDALPFDQTDPLTAVQLEYDLTMAVLDNPVVDILGHVFGMSYSRFKQNVPEEMIKNVITKASDKNIAIEINSQYHQTPGKFIKWCKELDSLICFGSNAHSLDEVGGVMTKLRQEIEQP